MEAGVASVKSYRDRLGRCEGVDFHLLAASPVLWDGSAEDDQSGWWRFFEQSQSLAGPLYRVFDVLPCRSGFYVAGRAELLSELSKHLVYPPIRRDVEADEFCAPPLLLGKLLEGPLEFET